MKFGAPFPNPSRRIGRPVLNSAPQVQCRAVFFVRSRWAGCCGRIGPGGFFLRYWPAGFAAPFPWPSPTACAK